MPTILLTRPEPAAGQFAQALRQMLGEVEVIVSPLMRIEWCGRGERPDGVPVFTSARGVEGFVRAWGRPGGPCWCVGDATAQAAGTAGFEARSAQGDAEMLVRAIMDSGEAGPFHHYRGAHARGEVAGRLGDAGRDAAQTVVYDQVAQALNPQARMRLDREEPVIVPLFSPRTAVQFRGAAPFRAPVFAAVMSDAVAAALGDLPCVRVAFAERPDAGAMLDAVKGLFDAALVLERAGGAQ